MSSTHPHPADERFMQAALTLARRGLGRVWPNPAVGCVIVRDGRIVGAGRTQPGGRPHAETEALAAAGDAARGATAYVTLEPCAHTGQTGPCAQALIDAGIVRVVAGLEDPDPRVQGCGFGRLRDAGVAVTIGVGADAARAVTAGFLSRIVRGRPHVTVKIATSLDGRIATATGHSQWITGPLARRAVHAMRARYDAIMVGAGTVRTDDPGLDVRLAGLEERSPVRLVISNTLNLPIGCKLLATAKQRPLWLLTAAIGLNAPGVHDLTTLGADVIGAATGADGHVDLSAALAELGRRGLTRIMVEGGGTLIGGLLRADLIDAWEWFRAGIAIGGDGTPAIGPAGIVSLDGAPRFDLVGRRQIGPDQIDRWVRAHAW